MKIAATLITWFHLIAAVTWLGGLIFMNVVLTPALAPRGIPPQFIRLMGMKRFAAFAWGSIAVLVVTGALKTLVRIGSVSEFFATSYNITLFIKIMIVALMIAITAVNNLILAPRLAAGAPQPPAGPTPETMKTQRLLVSLSHLNLSLGLTVLLLVAILRVTAK